MQLLHNAVEKYVAGVAVVNLGQFKVISQSVRKTDRKHRGVGRTLGGTRP
jgi:hypothetical protein